MGSSKDITKAKKLIHGSLLNQTCSSVKTVSQCEIKLKDNSEETLDDCHSLFQPPAKKLNNFPQCDDIEMIIMGETD